MLATVLLCLIGFTSNGQKGWNWPEDQDLKSVAMEKQAFYKVSIGLENWKDAANSLHWLYENNPDLNSSIYIDGAKVYNELLDQVKEEDRMQELRDSVLWTYDQRIKYFNEEASVIDRKAYTAFKMYYKDPSNFAMLADLYDKAYELNGPDLSSFNLIPYMTLAKYYHQRNPKEMPAERVLDIHDRVSQVIDASLSGKKAKKEQDKADAILSSIEGLLTCDFIESKLVPKLEADPEDLNTAKKIFSYSLKAKCSDQSYFTKAGDVLFKDDPTFQLASALGDKYISADELDKAINYYQDALRLATDEEQKYRAYKSLAQAHYKKGSKSTARKNAYQALSIMPGSNESYNLLGNLYFSSFQECKEGESKVLDRAVFIAAYEMYKKAGNNQQMQAAKDQFPSVEEIFNEGYEVGDEVTINCWISKTVELKTRD